ncbi:MAG: hypothetical protein V3U65_16565 [Granulosicoccaceae bacterium]
MSATTPSFNPTLESVQESFDHWRETRDKRSRTPISLQRRAVASRDSYPASHIYSALKINDTALKRWAHESLPDSPSLPAASHTALVELPAEPIAPAHCDSFANLINSLSIELDDSMQLHVQGSFTLEQLLCAARQHQRGACT